MVLDEARHNPVHDGMASTASSVWCLGERLIVGQVGDSRIYRFQNRTLKLVSQDQSPVGKLMLSGRITEAEAREHPMKNYVDEVLGGSRRVPKPQAEAFPLRDDDLFIICSDGLSDSLDDESIAHIVDKRLAEPVETIARELLDRALARAGHDNVSLIVVRAGSREGNRTTHRLARLFSSAPKVERTVIPPPGSDGAAS
jgi:protein phosphatase